MADPATRSFTVLETKTSFAAPVPLNLLPTLEDVTAKVAREQGSKQRSVIKEIRDYSVVQNDATTELNYLIMSVPKTLTYREKMKRVSLLADKVTEVEKRRHLSGNVDPERQRAVMPRYQKFI
jgi:hypothetical protein